jgi:hypothetical protein
MINGHLPHHMAWVAYNLQLWPGLCYWLGTMTNDIEEAASVLNETNYKLLNVLGVACTVTKGLQKLHRTFGGFGLLSIPMEQLICRINMSLQHYHTSTNLSRKLDASLHYLQLQLGMPHNPLTLDYDKWGHLAPLSWVKMLWRLLHHFNIHLHMECQPIPLPRERDQVVMELIVRKTLAKNTIQSLSRCQGALEIIFLLDMTTADGRYLEHLVFNPGGRVSWSKYKFPRDIPAKKDWEVWFNFGHDYTATGEKLHTPLGKWIAPTHRRWIWYYDRSSNDLQQTKDGKFHHYLPTSNHRQTRLTTTYRLIWEEDISPTFKRGAPTSIVRFPNTTINRLNKGAPLAKGPLLPTDFLGFPKHVGRDADVGRYQREPDD